MVLAVANKLYSGLLQTSALETPKQNDLLLELP